MEAGRSTAAAAVLAKAAFKRLAQAQLEPTPENYAQAYAEEAGLPPPGLPPQAPGAAADAAAAETRAQFQAWAALSERLSRNLERGGKQWTAARRKESLQRVFSSSRSEPSRLLQRLQALMNAWETDQPSDPTQTGAVDPLAEAPPLSPGGAQAPAWAPLLQSLEGTVLAGLPAAEARAVQLADQLSRLATVLAQDGITPERVAAIEAVCQEVRRLFGHRHHLVDGLSALCQELGAGLSELSEDDSWVRGQCGLLQASLGLDEQPETGRAGLTVRGVRAARNVLAETRQQQQRVQAERRSARDALRRLIQSMLMEVAEIGAHTGRFQQATAQHAQAIAQADSMESLAQVVHALLDDARTVQAAVQQSQDRLLADRGRAEMLEARVRELEQELRRLSEEVSTDALTQVANRRGLMQAFDLEVARQQRENTGRADGAAEPGVPMACMAIALIDIDNFKKLNDTLGHAAGDVALQRLAAAVRERLRPGDHLARFGGEEFVVLLPGITVEAAQQALTRLQRSLTEALFLHDGREVFVTFSGGVTAWQPGEALQAALERADEALYEAKRTGKNRTCMG